MTDVIEEQKSFAKNNSQKYGNAHKFEEMGNQIRILCELERDYPLREVGLLSSKDPNDLTHSLKL